MAGRTPTSQRSRRVAPPVLEPLTGLDALFLHLETAQMPMHVGSLSLLELPRGYRGDFTADLRRLIGARLHLAPPFTRQLATMPLRLANPVWTRATQVDLARHIRHVRLPAPGTLAQLEDCVARLHAQPLDRRRPLWELVVIEGLGGRYRRCVGYYAKVHHAAIDGQAGVQLARAMLDTTPVPRTVPPAPEAAPAEPPTTLQLLAAASRTTAQQLRAALELLPTALASARDAIGAAATPDDGKGSTRANAQGDAQGAAGRPARHAGRAGSPLLGPRTVLNRAIGSRRAFATASLPLAAFRALAGALDVTVNDLVLATTSGALRRWLARHGGVPDAPLYAGVPFSVRGADDTAANRVSMMRADLATHLPTARARLAAIHASMSRGKRVSGALKRVVPTDAPTLGAPWLLGAAAHLVDRTPLAGRLPVLANVAVSNVPGSPVPLYVAGAKMIAYWPVSIVVHGVALNVTVQSYAERMEFGITACARAMPDAAAFAADLRAAFAELKRLAARSPAHRAAKASA